ncbi:hypothetical protein AD928_00050 [Acetobacter cerevisiae]|uniref:Uncharacterized protein n=1 Tax=Acetobacter cerevisiae TaxID=178900 RepID=A0A149R432_9PROT|nr:hypothetical protein AD928_00050 [Acetobacter cerevisiae]
MVSLAWAQHSLFMGPLGPCAYRLFWRWAQGGPKSSQSFRDQNSKSLERLASRTGFEPVLPP